MEMEVIVPVPALDFNFDSACSTPYMSAPSSPQRFGNFFLSAPTSPSRTSSSFFRDPDDVSFTTSSSSTVPFDWEEKPGTPKSKKLKKNKSFVHEEGEDEDEDDKDFEFNFSGQLERTSLTADELFDRGKIRPLKPPPAYDSVSNFSPRSTTPRKLDFDPFVTAMEETRKKVELGDVQQRRGRDRVNNSTSTTSTYVRKGSRSLSPMRVTDIVIETEDSSQTAKIITSATSNPKSYASSLLSAFSFNKGSKKWKLKDLLLFRSASEGHATSKDQLKKYVVLAKKEAEDVKNASFRSTDSGVGSVSSSRRRGPVELHYTVNRAVSEELRRKTFLPYRQGLLGCLGFTPSNVHEISSRGFGSLSRI
ncbi:DUF1645 domain-containing protein [Cephalotus follicularis]|uniref:DUF1645 domain-containing protein n=1 Tax=Cephalotus follicularis TaxID=3775 RepID=A0A1Q3B028_CEPFO|nr:DUF1645 domain-containing protein [Cephalotus follicularis]